MQTSNHKTNCKTMAKDSSNFKCHLIAEQLNIYKYTYPVF